MFCAIVVAVSMTGAAGFAAPVDAPSQPKARVISDAERSSGTWLFESATLGDRSDLARVWGSQVTIAGERVALSKLMGHSKDLRGKLTLDATASPKRFTLALEKLDFSELGVQLELPAGTLTGIYKLDDDRLTLCFRRSFESEPPAEFRAKKDTYLITFARAPKGFKAFPEEIEVRVVGPDEKAAAGATVANFMSRLDSQTQKSTKPEWELAGAVKTSASGTVRVKYERAGSIIARDTERKLVGIATPSPATLASGRATVRLVPECRASVEVTCAELVKRKLPLGWTNAYLLHDGRPLAMCDSQTGQLEFVLPPGKYTLHTYGENLKTRFVPISVPKDHTKHTLAPIDLTATNLVLMSGHPAPELTGVMGWKGHKVKLADLKGKYVLLEFWGYWCGPCVGAMPVLIELHEKYADRGLVIVGVHTDADGEVDTAAKLDAKLAGYKADIWKGKDIPFANALVSGKRVPDGDDEKRIGAVGDYGISSFPTTVLIDREGKIVGKFHARDIKDASAEIEKLLGPKK